MFVLATGWLCSLACAGLCSALSSWLRWSLTADDELSCTMNLVNSAYYESIQALINPFVRPFCGASSKQNAK